MYDEKPPVYCKRCGTKLVTDNRVDEYNEQTGEPIIIPFKRKICPNQYCPTKYGLGYF